MMSLNSRANIFFVCGLPRSGTTAAIRGIRTFPNVYAIPYELALPEILYRLKYSNENKSFQPAFNDWLSRHNDQVVYRYNRDPDQHPYDTQLLKAYEQLLDQFRVFVGEPSGPEMAASSTRNFFHHIQRDSACDLVVEKSPSTAIFSNEASLISPEIKLISCVREPSAFIDSCIRRSQSTTEQEKAGFEGSEDEYIRELVYYFSRIRDSLHQSSCFLMQHECISFTPRTACGYLYAVLFNQAPDLRVLNKFNDIVGARPDLGAVVQQKYYHFASDLFAELGYPCRQALEYQPPIDQTISLAIQPYYGMIPIPEKWIKLNERFHAVLTRGEFSCIELELLCVCSTVFISKFVFEAQVNNRVLPVQIQFIGEVCKVRMDVTSIRPREPTLVTFRASSLLASFLASHCSDDLLYNIIVDIKYF